MWRLAVAQMRRSPGRLAAAGVAIALGSAFVAVTLLAGDVMTRTAYRAVTAQYADADIVLDGFSITDADATAIRDVPGVAAAEALAGTWVEVSGDSGTLWIEIDAPTQDARLEPRSLVTGRLPAAGEIALPDGAAKSLGIGVGDTATVSVSGPSTDSGTPRTSTTQQKVVGLVDDTAAGLVGSPVGLAPRDQVLDWITYQTPDETPTYRTLLVAADAQADAAALKPAVRAALDTTNADAGSITVRTLDEQAEWIISDLTSETRLLTTIGLGFAAIALLVAALVIANTFQVLVAQRTRNLALLRCVGADRSQLRRSVLIEAGLLGVLGSAAGIALGIGIVQAALLALGNAWPDVPLPTGARVTVWAVLVPLVLGVAVTIIASLAPARAATRVSPLAAMRPSDAPRMSDRAGRVRAWLAGTAVLVGGAVMVGGVAISARADIAIGLGLGVLGGATSFFGVVLSAVFWVPRLVAVVSRVVGRGPATRLAGANSARNPRRTAATSSALLIGVTLVVMMATGAASARGALAERLDEEYPFDVEASAMNDVGWPGKLPDALVGEFTATSGVDAVAVLSAAYLGVVMPDGSHWEGTEAVGMDPADGRQVLRADDQLDGLDDATVIVPAELAMNAGVTDGDTLLLSPPEFWPTDGGDPEPGAGTPTELTARVTELPGSTLVVTKATMAVISSDAPDSRAWVRLADDADPGDVVADLESAASQSSGSSVSVEGGATERAAYQRVIDTMLAIVVCLLAVSVAIALVGVANTLSLSVIERRRESATLRAIGLSRRQLRASLATEGMIIAGVGALAGAVIGTAYGWVGAKTVLDTVGPTPFVVAWREIAIVLAVAVVAGLAASVLPARSAVRTSPVEALAVE